jgi:hypothetical protein
VTCRLGEEDVPGLNAAYCHASNYPLGDFSGDFFDFFLLKIRVDLGVYNTVLLVTLVVSHDARLPDLSAKPLCFLKLLMCILKFQKGTCFFAEKYSEVFGSRTLVPLFYLCVPVSFSDERSI